jgi:hypothetical protein
MSHDLFVADESRSINGTSSSKVEGPRNWVVEINLIANEVVVVVIWCLRMFMFRIFFMKLYRLYR